ncbi:DUF221-domain-containing protein [Dissoconium aciculare CBS 342.82]|uniref:DUF221-domain-containing protein n=1 Tax=Dissoconium aciculare CBS 342.82 TaxID=1314786 RepID=A0A6J3M8I6_9PEZI|nr:DUF221-domain-containing protein [Dissoconium aciculare CBS 342.82]KAF1824371.1 DUF221-domain-containing protein [Dissoconium aciculare CBS 342.82]
MFTIMKEISTDPTSGRKILAAFIPTFLIALVYFGIFVLVRNVYRKFYAPRTFLGTIPEKHRTPVSGLKEGWWFADYKNLSDAFVLKHNSLDAYLYLRFLRNIIWICFLTACVTFPILIPVNITGGGTASQLDKLTFSNINKNSHIWAHVVVGWFVFVGIFLFIAWERLQLIGTRQACFLNESYTSRLSSRTVLFLNVPREALEPSQLKEVFGEEAERSWPVTDTKELDDLVEKRNAVAMDLERAQMDMIVAAVKRNKNLSGQTSSASVEEQSVVPQSRRPTKRSPPVIGTKVDRLDDDREQLRNLVNRVKLLRAAPDADTPDRSAIFVSFSSQQAAHIAFQTITFQPRVPLQDRYLAVQPKEVLWGNLAKPVAARVSKASLALAFVVAFTIFFTIPVGLIGTLSNAKELANRYEIFSWLNQLPRPILDLLTGLVPPALTSSFTSYVVKLFRHIAKLSGEPTTPQAELKTQNWFFMFQIIQVFIVTTFSSGVASVFAKVAQDPSQTPTLLAANLPKASNFYLTYIILQGTTNAANNLLNYEDLLEYLFYEYFWDKTPREKFTTFAQMKGTPWAAWYPKFANLFIIAIAYSCIAPLVTGFAAIGIFFYYLSYRYGLLYVRQTKIDTKGEAYKRALQHLPAGLYFAQLCMIGLFSARGAVVQTALMITLLVITSVANLLLDRMLRPLDLYLGVDKWQRDEVPLLAEEDGIDHDDEAALHAASHGRRLGIKHLPNPAPRWLSDFFDGIISSARERTKALLDDPSPSSSDSDDAPSLSEEDIENAYRNPVLTSKTPKLWIPRDPLGISKEEIRQNEEVDIATTDEGAEVRDNGRLIWNHHFDKVPIFSLPKVY